VVDAELDKHYNILIDNVVLPVSPASHAGATSGLIGVFATSVELVITVLDLRVD